MLPHLTFVLGGASSGKSAFAEKLVFQSKADRVYIATSQVFDDEMRKKVDAHLTMRGDGWHTIECPLDAVTALHGIKSEEVVLFDCATMWLTNHMLADHNIDAQTDALLSALAACKGRVVMVSNEVGMGIVPDNKLARQFRDAQGKLNQRLAAASDLAVFVVAGLPMTLKGQLP
ncbi:bifunctional adenosylcobinamide kinase/adenosylcobinamide-phosphate guanylyltransferase [Shimia thalassica]|uniref:bifunctional adenosylcobinamide kinase/adenosylcobinamide-phosphate guanylyltransferase n=1 Tax=Shimia thalassica TaxID=1715693 RepID=UPI0027333CA6|nr:bifunctional adenosylcobinamide kinase/adenosylcobinamide-phosphate guanylyltransferase [Shimia thalassica]MDP2517004.1 bifunctional adenosylcobinamide kinase/adenosylcobinamide-phosphate guanylyltransferase [Shimia thalassica]